MVNSPHLKPAFAIDSAIMDFSNDIKNYCGIDAIHTEDDFERVMGVFEKDILPSIKLWEYIAVDVDTNVAEFHKALQEGKGEVRVIFLIFFIFFFFSFCSLHSLIKSIVIQNSTLEIPTVYQKIFFY